MYSEWRKDKLVKCKNFNLKWEKRKLNVDSGSQLQPGPCPPHVQPYRPSRYAGSPHQFATVTQPEWEWALEATIEMNQIHHCLQGRGAEQRSLMHQSSGWGGGGLQWVHYIQATPVCENCIDFITTLLCPLAWSEGSFWWNTAVS